MRSQIQGVLLDIKELLSFSLRPAPCIIGIADWFLVKTDNSKYSSYLTSECKDAPLTSVEFTLLVLAGNACFYYMKETITNFNMICQKIFDKMPKTRCTLFLISCIVTCGKCNGAWQKMVQRKADNQGSNHKLTSSLEIVLGEQRKQGTLYRCLDKRMGSKLICKHASDQEIHPDPLKSCIWDDIFIWYIQLRTSLKHILEWSCIANTGREMDTIYLSIKSAGIAFSPLVALCPHIWRLCHTLWHWKRK